MFANAQSVLMLVCVSLSARAQYIVRYSFSFLYFCFVFFFSIIVIIVQMLDFIVVRGRAMVAVCSLFSCLLFTAMIKEEEEEKATAKLFSVPLSLLCLHFSLKSCLN